MDLGALLHEVVALVDCSAHAMLTQLDKNGLSQILRIHATLVGSNGQMDSSILEQT